MSSGERDGGEPTQATDRRASGVPLCPRRAEDFESSYDTVPPWDIDRPQPAFQALANSGDIRGRFLDVGCGTGEHALMAAGLGLVATGVDASRTAIEKAEHKARARNQKARFVVGDALELTTLEETYDTVVDCGLFHIFDDDDRARYVASLAAVVRPGGRYFMACFSQQQPGGWGPRRVNEHEIRESFVEGWQVDAIEPSRLVLTTLPDGVFAWLAKLTRS